MAKWRGDWISGYSIAAIGLKLSTLPDYAVENVALDGTTNATSRGRLNAITGRGKTLTLADNAGTNSKDLTIADNGIVVNAQTGNYTAVAADFGKLIRMTGTVAQELALTAAATLTAGWWCMVENANTGTTALAKTLTINPSGAEVIDTLANGYDYPGAVRLIVCVNTGGAEFRSEVLHGGQLDILNADSPFTLNIPTNYNQAYAETWGSGAGGGAGGVAVGGTGGGGASYVTSNFRPGDLGASVTVTVPAGGAAGSGGGATTFGTLITGYGGGAGQAGGASVAGGGGGSIFATASGTAAGAGGNPGGGVAGGANANGGAANIGGASGGGAGTGSAKAGGVAYKGGKGGGSGGAVVTQTTGGDGGGLQTSGSTSGGGGAGGAPSADGTPASNGTVVSTAATALGPGLGGGGGGGNSSTGNGGNGAVGGIACGGGGGGGAATGTPGAGGAGGPGLARFSYD